MTIQELLGMEFQSIKIEGYRNLWSAFDTEERDGSRFYIMENDTYGDETCYLVITEPDEPKTVSLKSGGSVMYVPESCVVCETYDDITTALDDCLGGFCK